MSKIELYHGDCLEVMDRLIKEGVKVDAIITDPPYGSTQCKWDNVIPIDRMWSRLKLLRKKKAPIVLFGTEPFSSMLRMSNIKEYKHDWIWDKNTPTGFQLAKYRPMKREENILIFGKGSINYYPIMTDREKSIYGFVKNKSESNPIQTSDGKTRVYTKRYPQSIISFQKVSGHHTVHPTQKPVALMEYLIETYTKEGDTVLDFTMGSGTTGVACKNLNRNFIGIELDETYFKIAEERITQTLK